MVHDVLGFNYMLVTQAEYADERLKAVEGAVASLQAFAQLAKTRGFALLVVVHPDHWEAVGKQYNEAMLVLVDNLRRGEIPFVDVLDDWKLNGLLEDAESLYWPIDGHNNANGYALLAKAVSRKLDEMGLPPAP